MVGTSNLGSWNGHWVIITPFHYRLNPSGIPLVGSLWNWDRTVPLDEAIECQEDGRAAVVDGFSSSVWFFLGICWDMNGILTVYYWNIHWIWMGYEYIPSGNDCPTMIWLLQRVSTIWIATTRHDISNADGYWWMGFINQHHIPSGNDCPIAIENKYHLEWSKNKIFSAIRSGHLAQCNLLNWFLSTLW